MREIGWMIFLLLSVFILFLIVLFVLKKKFQITKKVFLICLIVFLLIELFLFGIVFLLYRYNYIPHKKYSNEQFSIPTYQSKMDQDEDGIDDQTDILNNVKEYIATKPKYESEYYVGGYPDNEYGVCTDVVAFGLKGAGYDLRELVYEDILAHPDDYDIDIIDKDIDFRRVHNLKVYFEHHTIRLTMDITKIEEWQGGDIVVFENHIGIISDKRNQKGIPFVIHHTSDYQSDYEEDILEIRDDIVGHYRMS